jgi:SAM-dependent methyltransferase
MTKTAKKENMKNPCLSPGFWKGEIEKKGAGNRGEKALSASCWDNAADTYDDLESCDDYKGQMETVLEILRRRNALAPENDIIDVACGTGSYAIRFAPECRSVRCVDISPAMLRELEKKKSGRGIENITIECSDWQTFRSDRQYDLVFISMSPILRLPGTIDRLLALSSRHLCIVTWAGVRENPLLASLYKELFGSMPAMEKCHAFQGIFNYLFTCGHSPEVRFFNGCWERTRDVEGAVRGLLWRLDMHRTLTEEEKDLVRSRVMETATGNRVTVKTRVRTAALFIDKSEQEVECT